MTRFLLTLAACAAATGLVHAQTPARAQAPAPTAGATRGRATDIGATVLRNQTPDAPSGGSGGSGGSSGSGVYLVGPQDVVEVRVFQEDDLQTTARVAQDGTIKFPLIGSVRVAGKTEDTAAQLIGTQLAKEYLVNPQVTVKVVEYAQRRYTVLGQVGKPGTYAMPDRENITLLEAIGNAGGFTRIADQADIKLKRLVDGKETYYKLAAKGNNTRQSSSFEIKPGDIITVGETIF